MHCYGRICFIPFQNLSNICPFDGEEKFIVIKKCNPACFVAMTCNTMLVALRKSRYLWPFIKGDTPLFTIRSKCSKVVVSTIVVVEIKVFEADDLVKLNPFRQKPCNIFEL